MKHVQLNKFETKEGEMLPIYKDWEEYHDGYIPKMCYVTSLNPGLSKGPIFHKEKSGFMTALTGIVSLETVIDGKKRSYTLRNNNGNYVVLVPANVPYKIINSSEDEVALVLNLPDKAWTPDEKNETLKFDSWESYLQWQEK